MYYFIIIVTSFGMLFNISNLYGQAFTNTSSLSLANIKSVVQDNWSAVKNPASGADDKSFFAGTSFFSLYNIKNFNYISGIITAPLYNNKLSFSVVSYGIPEYKESIFTFAYGRALTPKFNFGLAFSYNHLNILNYSKEYLFSLNIGAQYLLTDNFMLGLLLENISNSKYDKSALTSKFSSFNLGLAYFINKKTLKILSEIRKSLDYPVDIALGVNYRIMQWLYLSSGLSTSPFKQYYGVKLNVKSMVIDFAFSVDRKLQTFPSFSLGYLLPSAK